MSLQCTYPKCGKPQTSEGEFCENHFPRQMLVHVGVRGKTSRASCGCEIKRDEKYVYHSFNTGRYSESTTCCRKCWQYTVERVNDALKI